MKTKKKPNLKAKLDKVFSEYIRKRDTHNGVFKCISCGRILPYEQADCGHYINRKHMSTRFDEMNCNAQCRSCLTSDTLILMSDFRWKKLGDIEVGEVLFSFDENSSERKTSRRYRTSIVLSSEKEIQDIYEVTLENGDVINATSDHKWLARRGKTSGFQWMRTDELWFDSYNLKGKHITGSQKGHVFSTICKPFMVVNQDYSYNSGWLSGIIDADGHITQQKARDKRRSENITYGLRIGISQMDGEIAEKANKLLIEYSSNRSTSRQDIPKILINNSSGKIYYPNGIVRTYLITGTNVEKIQFLQRVRPLKISRVDINKLGKMRSQYDTQVKSIRYIGKKEIIAMETDSHTFIANGYAMHNCNRFDEGNIQGYRRGLVALYGEQQVTLLEAKKHNLRKYSDFEYEVLIKHYKEEIKKL